MRRCIDTKIRKVINSINSMNPICKHFSICGGCQIQNIEYLQQLKNKEYTVRQLTKDFVVEEYYKIVPSVDIWFYRNKMEFIIGKDKTGQILSGLREKNKFYKIVNLEECRISFEETYEILNTVKNWVKENNVEPYDLFTHKGKARYIVVRQSKSDGSYMLNLVVTGTKYQVLNNEKQIFDRFVEEVKKINKVKSVYLSINNKISDNAVAEEMIHLYGEESICEIINDVKYKIYPQTFVQPNTKTCEVMYKILLNEVEEGNVLDLYCGSGGITLQIAKHVNVDKIIGVDNSKENINVAEKNLQENQFSKNIEFVCENVETFVQKLWKSKFISNLSTLIVDPPRPGLSKKVKAAVVELPVNKIIYVSCNPQTLVEDLKTFTKFYRIKKIIPIDMFPHTNHIEVMCVLEHK